MSTRITAFMLFNQFSNSLNRNLRDMGKVQTQLATGKRITKPSDDVIGLRGSMAYKVSINALHQFGRNIDEGNSALSLTESAMNSTTNLFNRVRELAISESNDTANADSRNITSFEISNLFNELIDIGNSKLNDKYLFSGYLTKTQSFSSTGTYQGDSNNIDIFIGDGIKSKTNITGDAAFSDTSKLVTGSLAGQTLSGNIRITSGTGTPYFLSTADVLTAASPEEVRDTINASMTGAYAATDEIGTGTLTLSAGTGSPVTLLVYGPPVAPAVTPVQNNTPTLLRDAINGLNMGITAGIYEDAAGNERLFFRPTTAGEGFSVEVSIDGDGNDTDTVGLSALLHNDIKSNLTDNALGVEAHILDDGTNNKRMFFEPSPAGTTFALEVDEDGDGNFAEAGDGEADTTGLSLLHHNAATTSNLSGNSFNTITFFEMLNHFSNSLSSNDSAGIQSSILLVDGVLDSVVNTTADVGSRLKYFEGQKLRLEDSEVSFKTSLAVLEDADIAEAAMEMMKIQSTLEAMRISSVRNLTQSLFDFMG